MAGGLLPAESGPHPAAGRAGGRGLGLRGGLVDALSSSRPGPCAAQMS